MNSYVKAT